MHGVLDTSDPGVGSERTGLIQSTTIVRLRLHLSLRRHGAPGDRRAIVMPDWPRRMAEEATSAPWNDRTLDMEATQMRGQVAPFEEGRARRSVTAAEGLWRSQRAPANPACYVPGRTLIHKGAGRGPEIATLDRADAKMLAGNCRVLRWIQCAGCEWREEWREGEHLAAVALFVVSELRCQLASGILVFAAGTGRT